MEAKTNKSAHRALALVLALVLCLTLLIGSAPGTGTAASGDGATWVQVTSADQFTTGQYYMVTDTGYAPGAFAGSWLSAIAVTDGTAPDNATWTLTVSGNTVKMQTPDGQYAAPSGGNNNGIKVGDYSWAWEFENGTFTFSGQGEDTVILASNKGSENKFRAYKNNTVSGNTNGYPFEFTLYRLDGGSGGTTVAAPQASPQAGSVTSGTEITLSTTTAGASIYYTLNGVDPTGTASDTEFLYSAPFAITGEAGAEVTLKAMAVLDGVSSEVQTIKYTIRDAAAAPIADRDRVVIYNPAHNKALSSTYDGYYNEGTDVTIGSDGTVSGFTSADVWTVVDNEDGTWSFSYGGQNLGMGDSRTSMPLGGKNDKWELIDAGNGCWYIRNTVRDAYIEWFANNNNWSAYYNIESGSENLFALQFYKVTGEVDDPSGSELPIKADDKVGIYLPSSGLVITTTASGSRLSGAAATLADGTLTTEADNAVFTVGGNNTDGFTFASADGKYLTTSATGNTLSMADTAGEYSLWILEQNSEDGWFIRSKNAAFYDNAQYIEYFVSSFTTYSKYDNSDLSIYTFQFYPVAASEDEPGEELPDGLVVLASPVSGATVEEGDTITLTTTEGATIYYTVNGDDPTTSSTPYTEPLTIGEGSGQVPAPTDDDELVIRAIAVIPATGETEAQVGEVYTFTYRAPDTLDGYTLYFGQLHSHTDISDGAGSVEDAFEYASQVENLDFLAVTDHSNSFDNHLNSNVNLGADLLTNQVSEEWVRGHEAAEDITEEGTFVGIYGFEMTWTGGFGHINTFNTPGFESRESDEFPNNPTGHVNYYNKLVEVESSLSQFNHPGTTFGDFGDFAYYSQSYDERINLIEVGNGEGAIGSSGYFPSYEYYTRALDKGWHVAPTNNQDNHQGNWGDSNTARSVVLAYDLTEEAIYDAIANHRVYATEDNDLSILYSLNGNVMGSIIGKQNAVTITAQIEDPTDTGDMTVEVIVNGGLVIGTKTVSGGSGTVTFSFDSNDYSYYYLRVTQADRNIAVTAPVWTGEGINAGISKTECDTVLVVKDEEVNISSELFNNSNLAMTVNRLVYTVDGNKIYEVKDVSTIGENGVISTGGTATVSFPHTFTTGGATTVNVTMEATIGETQYTFTSVLQLTVTDESLVTRILVDGTHWNDYVTGYYANNMGNFTELAAGMNAQVTIKQPGEEITQADLNGVSLLVVTAPLKYDGRDDLPEGATQSVFSKDFIDLVANYAKSGGTVILCGLADYQDNNNGAPYCSTEQINPILEAMGSTLRLNDDEVLDDDTNYNGGASQTYRVYMDDFNTEELPELFVGLQEGQRYSAYSGCSVDLGENGVAIVWGSDNCYSINSKTRPEGAKGDWDSGKPVGSTASGSYDADTAVVQKGDVVTLATEAVGAGRVYVAGTVFLSDFEISNSSDVDYGDASYANKTIITNILSGLLKDPDVSTIAQARAGEDGDLFTVEGTVIAGSVEPNAFFDCIYIQDSTGAICLHPVNSTVGTFQVGQKVRATGYRGNYQGDVQLGQVISAEVIDDDTNPIPPTEYTLAEASDYATNGGDLAKVSGTVQSVESFSGQISTVILTDGTNEFRLLFNNYIGYSDETSPDITTFVKEGAEISAVGVIYWDPAGVCLRVRDLSEVELVTEEEPSRPNLPSTPSTPPDDDEPEEPFADVDENDWFYDAVVFVYSEGMMDGVSDTQFEPGSNLTRGMVVTILYRLEGEPRVTGSSGFTDVASGAWYADAVTWAAENGIVNGVSDTEFAPNTNITREQFAAILYRYADYRDLDVSGQDSLADFTDRGSISAYALEAMRWAVYEGLINGMTETTIVPQGTATRAQAATMFMRFMSVVE